MSSDGHAEGRRSLGSRTRRTPKVSAESDHGAVSANFPLEHEYTAQLVGQIKILETLATCEPEMLEVFVEHRVDTSVQELLSVLSDIYDKELVGVIGWAKQIPGNCVAIQRAFEP